MKITIRSKLSEVDQSVREHIKRRLQFSLGRLATRIAQVRVRIADLNGPRGGVDKTCRIDVAVHRGPDVFIEDRDAELLAVIDRAAQRAGRAVARTIERTRDKQRYVSTRPSEVLSLSSLSMHEGRKASP